MRIPALTCLSIVFMLSSFQPPKKSKLKLPDEFVKIPGGNFKLPDDNNITVSEFYMSKFEITNFQYRTFFSEVSGSFAPEKRERIACDTSGWERIQTANAPMKKYYFSHPAYNHYPVVNITWDGATEYCRWLQQKIQLDNPGFEISVQLPTRHQWIWAAMGGRSQAMFPWGNFYLRNRKGEFMCNFKRVADHAIYRNRQTGKPEVAEVGLMSQVTLFTTAVKSFYPNDYKLYNMCGNAAEMIDEQGIGMGGSWNDYGGDVQIRAEAKYESSAATIGFRPVVVIKERK